MLTELMGCKLFYLSEESVRSNAETVLLLHGWGCSSEIFAPLRKSLINDCNIIAVDFPGHGQSGEPPVPWGVPEYAGQIVALLDSLSIPKVHIVAHSFGGRVAIYLASHYPERIGKMVLTGAAGIRKPSSGEKSKKQMRYKKLKKLVSCMQGIPFLRKTASVLQEKLVQKFGSRDYAALSPEMRKTFVKVIEQDLSPMLSSIRASVLLVWGSNDTETPLWMGQQMEKTIPDSALVVFDGRSHFAFVEESERFFLVTRAMLAEGD